MQFKTSFNHDLATGSDIVLGHMAKIPACPVGKNLQYSHVHPIEKYY